MLISLVSKVHQLVVLSNFVLSLLDFFKRQHHTSDPEISKIIYESQPKKKHRALNSELVLPNPGDNESIVEPAASLVDSFASSGIGIANLDDFEDTVSKYLFKNSAISKGNLQFYEL